MKYENFEEFISNLNPETKVVMDEWIRLSAKYKKQKRFALVILLALNAIAFVLIAILLNKDIVCVIYRMFINIFIADVFIYIFCIIIFKSTQRTGFYSEYKEKVIDNMLQNFIDELDYIPKKALPCNIYDEANYGTHYNKYYADDYFEGKISEQKITMGNLLVQNETTTIDSEGNAHTQTDTIFSGLFSKINLKKSINNNLILTPKYNFNIYKKKKVEMDHYEFEKEFNIYCGNKIIAMQIFTSDIQDYILELYRKYKISFDLNLINSDMYLLFHTGNLFEVCFTKKMPTAILKEYFEIMKFVYMLTEKMINVINNTQI